MSTFKFSLQKDFFVLRYLSFTARCLVRIRSPLAKTLLPSRLLVSHILMAVLVLGNAHSGLPIQIVVKSYLTRFGE